MLFHVSEEGGIDHFDPRPSAIAGESVVWAIDAERLRNYLLPRECPRVTFHAGRQTTAADRAHCLKDSPAVIVVEEGWLSRVQSCRLYCYGLPTDTFECLDECAGYHVSRVAVRPAAVEILDDAVAELRKRGVELRTMPNLWPLRDVVIASSLQFSIIRMRNALPREFHRLAEDLQVSNSWKQ
jgi:hypothetical protein